MTIKEFNQKYKKQGGYLALKQMVKEKRTLEFIAAHFGADDKQLASFWIRDIMKKKYDPRKHRKERVVESMLKHARDRKLTEKQFRDAYYYAAPYYLDIALVEGSARGVFKKT